MLIRTEEEIISNWINNNILLSVCCPSYNQENFIRDAIEGFLIQKTNFPIEVLIYDDASTDETSKIIREYEKKYPNIIKPIYSKKNQYLQGKKIFFDCIVPHVRGNYIALCDGDDYWTNSLKLQKQVDFLEDNPEFAGCFHNTKIVEDGNEEEVLIVNNPQKDIFTIDDFTRGEAYFHTSSVIYRYAFKGPSPYDDLHKHHGDWFISMVFSQYGPIQYIDEVMSAYRIHDKGVWSLLDKKQQVLKNLKSILDFNKIFDYKYEDNFLNLFVRVSISEFQNLAIDNIKSLFNNLEKDTIIKIILKLYESLVEKDRILVEKDRILLEKDRILLEKENYIDEKHRIIIWYEGVVKTLNEDFNK